MHATAEGRRLLGRAFERDEQLRHCRDP
jgi:hypothetical protein